MNDFHSLELPFRTTGDGSCQAWRRICLRRFALIDINTAKEHEAARLGASTHRLSKNVRLKRCFAVGELAGLSTVRLIQTLAFAHTAPLGDV